MLVRHLMLEVNKGWHFRDALIILLLNTTLARLQTFMTLDLFPTFSIYFFFFKQASYAFQGSFESLGSLFNAHVTHFYRATCPKFLYNSRPVTCIFFPFKLYPNREWMSDIKSLDEKRNIVIIKNDWNRVNRSRLWASN